MTTIDQQLWNALFGWQGTGQCMLPEGCTVPVVGVLLYVAVLVFVAAAIIKREELLNRLRGIQREIFE